MGHLNLALDKPTVRFLQGEGLFSKPGWQLTWRVEFRGLGATVKLSNGLRLENMPGSLILRVGNPADLKPTDVDEEPPKSAIDALLRGGAPIGLLYYLPASEGSGDGVFDAQPDAYSIELVIPEEDHRRLVEAVLAGHGPSVAGVSVPGITAKWVPDLADWELREGRNWVVVDGIQLSFDPFEDEEPAEPKPDEPPALSEETRTLVELTRYAKGYGPWLLGLLAAIFLALVLRR